MGAPVAYLPLNESIPEHVSAKGAFENAARLMGIDLNEYVSIFRVDDSPTSIPMENTVFTPNFRGSIWNMLTKSYDEPTQAPTITLDNDFLSASPEVKEYVALHELHHAQEWHAAVKSSSDLLSAWNKFGRFALEYDPVAYLQREQEIERSIGIILNQCYGGDDAIPSDVTALRQQKSQTDLGWLNSLQQN